jgi:hypothetical protein
VGDDVAPVQRRVHDGPQPVVLFAIHDKHAAPQQLDDRVAFCCAS